MKRKLSEIKISESFAATMPSEVKMEECRRVWKEFERQDRYIVVNPKGVLIDGYIQYLVLKENGVEEACIKESAVRRKRWFRKNTVDWNPPLYKTEKTTYVYGMHFNKQRCAYSKEYVWRVPKLWSSNGWEDDVNIGDTILVATKYGVKPVVVTRVEKRDQCPVDMPVQKVVKKFSDGNK